MYSAIAYEGDCAEDEAQALANAENEFTKPMVDKCLEILERYGLERYWLGEK